MFLLHFSASSPKLNTNYAFSNNFLYILLIIALVTISCSECVCCGFCSQLDRDSLSSLNISISAAPPLNWPLSVDCCRWEGVGCDHSGRVTDLWLPSRGLAGSIPSSIQNLTRLSKLSLYHNRLSGPLPDIFFASLNRLQVINLSHNRLSGGFTETDQLPGTIRVLDLSSNSFHGMINSSFLDRASNLETFDVSNNSFSGPLPLSLCRFSSSVRRLDFSNNDFDGLIPRDLGLCSNLQSLRAGFNRLSGGLPQDIYRLLKLRELYMPGNMLSGQIDDRVVELVNLKILALYGNNLRGAIPRDIGRLSNLEQLLLHVNRLNGTIPPSLANCTKLSTLNLRVNSLEGKLETFEFSKFLQLKSLDLGNNFFNGGFPRSLFSCKKLSAIRLSTNRLNGEIPSGIDAWQSLSYLSVSKNSLTNVNRAIRILAGCKNLTVLILSRNFYQEQLPGNENLINSQGFFNLQVLGFGGCRLNGGVPLWLSKLNNLKVLDLSVNYITGSIPGWIGGLPNLFYLDLSYNNLSGYFPVELTKMKKLTSMQSPDQAERSYLELPVFILRSNAFSLQYERLSSLPPALYINNNTIRGTIPAEIGQLQCLIVLNLSNNDFSGTIPDTISRLTNLEKLHLSGNHLSGEIPGSLQSLHFLSSFSVAFNNLRGPTPNGGQFDTFPSSSFEGNPELCGRALQRGCPDGNEATEETKQDQESETGIINWIGFEVGFAVSFILTLLAALKFLQC